ncbi:siderophore ABC transporter substrate-binding protein [Falsirhodobacter halotolerans]|uniref:siderophore ABC transporter substrate-binding protein n=1 Tax=Falsirhodobacter halotolerans TaxID=1146892 RepID=UPI001FD493FD|nr:siderophore ABC transporter substrate-binding protein [Falsirhodobacter halotolerans]MCJ8139801.1 siderophore ABC transporter substrate-binding protein [Falsirhodobacter halotolerans]
MKRSALGVIAAFSMTAAAPLWAAPVTIAHQQGEVTLPKAPQSVVVLDWANVDTLDALGVPIAGVPGSNVPDYLSKFAGDDYAKLGSLQEPDVEGIAALNPDLVIVAARSRRSQPQLNGIVPTVDMSIDNADFIASVKANILEYGEIFGRGDRAREMVADLDAKVERLRAAAQGKGTAMTLVTSGNKLGVYGAESRTSWLQREVGFPTVTNAVDDRSDRGDAASFEFILEANPDWLFVVDRDAGVGQESGEAARALLDNELVRQTSAWTKDQVVYLDPQRAYVVMNGYQALSDLLDQVHDAVSDKG